MFSIEIICRFPSASPEDTLIAIPSQSLSASLAIGNSNCIAQRSSRNSIAIAAALLRAHSAELECECLASAIERF